MTGGLLQLVAYGENDIFLTGNPQITFFKTVYRKPTNFAIESIKHPYTSPIYPNSKITFNIAREGDLVSDIMLKMNGLTQDALAAIEYVECSIGGNVIDRQYGDWMNIWSDLSHNIDKTKLLNELRNGRGFIDVPVTIDQNQPSPIDMSNLQIDEIIDYPIDTSGFSNPINIVKHSSGQLFFTKTGGTQAKLATINLTGEVSEISVETGLSTLDYIGIMGNSIYSIARGTSGNISRLTLTSNGDYDSMDTLWIDEANPPEVGDDKDQPPSIDDDGNDVVGYKTGTLNDIKGNDNMLLIASDEEKSIVRVYDNSDNSYQHHYDRLPTDDDIELLINNDGSTLIDGDASVATFFHSLSYTPAITVASSDGNFIYWSPAGGYSGLIRRLDLRPTIVDGVTVYKYNVKTILGSIGGSKTVGVRGDTIDGNLGTSKMWVLWALCISNDNNTLYSLETKQPNYEIILRKIDLTTDVFTVTTIIDLDVGSTPMSPIGEYVGNTMAIDPNNNYILYTANGDTKIKKINLIDNTVSHWFGDGVDNTSTTSMRRCKSILFHSPSADKLLVYIGIYSHGSTGSYRIFDVNSDIVIQSQIYNDESPPTLVHGSIFGGSGGLVTSGFKTIKMDIDITNNILYTYEIEGTVISGYRDRDKCALIRSHQLDTEGKSISTTDVYNSRPGDGMGWTVNTTRVAYVNSYFYCFGPFTNTDPPPEKQGLFRLPLVGLETAFPPYYLKQHTSILKIDGVSKIIETMALDSNDNIYICFKTTSGLYKVLSGADKKNTPVELIVDSNDFITQGSGIFVDQDESIYISCKHTRKIFKYKSGTFTHIAGDGNDATANNVDPLSASFSQPTGLCISSYNDLMICDANGKLRVMGRYNPYDTFAPAPVAVTSYVPLQFWFCKNPGLAIPLIALEHHDIKITVQFAKSLNGITDIEAWVDYFFIDTDERKRFTQISHEYLIEQVQYSNKVHVSTPTITGGTPQEILSSVAMQFNHPVKELYWTINQENISSISTGTEQSCSISNQGGTQTIQAKTALMRLNNSDRFMARDGKYFTKVQRYQHHSGAGINTTRLGVDSNDVSSELVTSKWYPKVANIHTYSFALHPEDHQPCGTCNFSRITNAFLDNTFDTPSVDGTYNYYINVYAVNYNVLRIIDGMGGLLFTN